MKKQELLAFIDQMLREYKDQTTVHFEPKPTRNDMHPNEACTSDRTVDEQLQPPRMDGR